MAFQSSPENNVKIKNKSQHRSSRKVNQIIFEGEENKSPSPSKRGTPWVVNAKLKQNWQDFMKKKVAEESISNKGNEQNKPNSSSGFNNLKELVD